MSDAVVLIISNIFRNPLALDGVNEVLTSISSTKVGLSDATCEGGNPSTPIARMAIRP